MPTAGAAALSYKSDTTNKVYFTERHVTTHAHIYVCGKFGLNMQTSVITCQRGSFKQTNSTFALLLLASWAGPGPGGLHLVLFRKVNGFHPVVKSSAWSQFWVSRCFHVWSWLSGGVAVMGDICSTVVFSYCHYCNLCHFTYVFLNRSTFERQVLIVQRCVHVCVLTGFDSFFLPKLNVWTQ